MKSRETLGELFQSVYKTGIEIPWSLTESSGHLTVDVYKIVKTLVGPLNKVDLRDGCENSLLFNTDKQLRVELEYSWTFDSEMNEMIPYNNAVRELRMRYNKPISYFLENLEALNRYQNDLALKLLNHPSSVDVEEVIDEDKISAAEIQRCLKRILRQGLPIAEQLAKQVPLKSLEKFDDFLPEDLLCLGYGAIAFDLKELEQWLELVCNI